MARYILPIIIFTAAFFLSIAATVNAEKNSEGNMIERWGIYELTLNGPDAGNPFTEVELTAEFKQNNRTFEPNGFYDGNGIYKIRFMPDAIGEWTYTTKSNRAELDGQTGQFTCVEPSEGNHLSLIHI